MQEAGGRDRVLERVLASELYARCGGLGEIRPAGNAPDETETCSARNGAGRKREVPIMSRGLRCHWCKQPLIFEPGRGYIHEGGGNYLMRCDECGWEGSGYPSPTACPKCGSRNIRDLHCALPEVER